MRVGGVGSVCRCGRPIFSTAEELLTQFNRGVRASFALPHILFVVARGGREEEDESINVFCGFFFADWNNCRGLWVGKEGVIGVVDLSRNDDDKIEVSGRYEEVPR